MIKGNRIGIRIAIFLLSLTLLFLTACGSGGTNADPGNDAAGEYVTIITGILIEASTNAIVIQAPDGTTYTFGINDNTYIEGSEYLGNTLKISFIGDYKFGINAVTIKTIVEVDHDSEPDKGYITEPDAPKPSEPAPEDETIWYMTGIVVDVSATGLHLLYTDGITYTVVIDENTKRDPGIIAGCVARVFRRGSMREGMLALEIQFISATPTPNPSPTPEPTPAPTPVDDSGIAPGDIVEHAKSLIGTPYKSGGAGTDGFDNSGFIYYVLNRNGVKCPRTTREQVSIGQVITNYDDLQATDLVFFGDGSGSSTVQYGGIYIGNGTMVYCSYRDSIVTQRDISQQWHRDAFVLGVRIR